MIWNIKKDSRILWIDIETELEVKPDRVMDCRKTDFPDKHFNLIIFDPPYYYGNKINEHHYSCRNFKDLEKLSKKKNGFDFHGLSYYGSDKVKTQTDVIKLVYLSQKEFQRILKDEGILFFKWNEIKIPLHKMLNVMNKWFLMMKLHISSPAQTFNKPKSKTFWLFFLKNLDYIKKQQELN